MDLPLCTRGSRSIVETSNDNVEIDQISAMPNEVIGIILSLVPIKDAVKTSVLSRDWKYKWAAMVDIEISDEGFLCFDSTSEAFVGSAHAQALFDNCLTRILNNTRYSKLNSFSLSCHGLYHSHYFETWISTVLYRGIQKLTILYNGLGRLGTHWNLLSELVLQMDGNLELPDGDTSFPNLKKLLLGHTLGNTGILRVGVNHKALTVFPVLEDFEIGKCEFSSIIEFRIPRLLHFGIYGGFEDINHPRITIVGDSLRSFKWKGGSIRDIDLRVSFISSIALAQRDFFFYNPDSQGLVRDRVLRILRRCATVEVLKISNRAIKVLVPPLAAGFDFTMFRMLKELHIREEVQLKDAMDLLKVLQPLESLSLSVYCWDEQDETGLPWPPLIVSNIKKMTIRYFSGSKLQYDFTSFAFENAKKLEEMYVLTDFRLWIKDEKSMHKQRLLAMKPLASRLFVGHNLEDYMELRSDK